MSDGYTDLLKYVDDALAFAKSIPRQWSKFSNKIYCNHQKLAMYVLMQKLKTTTRGIITILRASEELRLHLGLARVPVHTTIVRFANRIQFLVGNMLGIRQAHIVAIDSTGFSLDNRSAHYEKVLASQNNRKLRRFVKTSVAINTRTKEILSYELHHDHTHDSNDFIPLLKGVNCDHVVADKGYDSKKLRQFVIHKLKARPHIPRRRCTGRRRRIPEINLNIYHQRSLVENVFFCIKQKYGSVLKNRTLANQNGEVISKLIAHNLDRKQKLPALVILLGLHQRLLYSFGISLNNIIALFSYHKNEVHNEIHFFGTYRPTCDPNSAR